MATLINNAWQADGDGSLWLTEQEALDREAFLLEEKKKALLASWVIQRVGNRSFSAGLAEFFARNTVDDITGAATALSDIDSTTL